MSARERVKQRQVGGDLVAVAREMGLEQILEPGERALVEGRRDDERRVIGHRYGPGLARPPRQASAAARCRIA